MTLALATRAMTLAIGVMTLAIGAMTLVMAAGAMTLVMAVGAMTLVMAVGAMALVMAVGAITIRILIRLNPFLLPAPLYSAVSVRVLSVGCVDAEHYRECYRSQFDRAASLVMAGLSSPCPYRKFHPGMKIVSNHAL